MTVPMRILPALLLVVSLACSESKGPVAPAPDTVSPADTAASAKDSSSRADTNVAPACVSDSECDDGISCTEDTCTQAGCESAPNAALCKDDNACTEDSCDITLGCQNIVPEPACDDGNACTTDSCDPATGCVHSPDDSACDDGIACTEDTCSQETGCTHTANDTLCEDDNVCTDDTCDVSQDCTYTPNQAPCDDGDKCTNPDMCSQGECAGMADPTCIYTVDPDLDACFEGVLAPFHKIAALNQVNLVRALSNLPPVEYAEEGDLQAQRSSLIMLSNSSLSHQPPKDWLCWSQEGYDGADSSNLHISWKWESAFEPSEKSVNAFLIDDKVESLGHRRWILDPFLKQVAYGAVHGKILAGGPYPYGFTSSLKVIWDVKADISSLETEFVAYPLGDYPQALFKNDWYFSFSALVDTTKKWNNKDVDLSGVKITVTHASSGEPLNVHSVQADNSGFGLPNNVQWKVDGLKTGVSYSVTVSGITYQGEAKNYAYTFKLTD